jgi:hypothetical protein
MGRDRRGAACEVVLANALRSAQVPAIRAFPGLPVEDRGRPLQGLSRRRSRVRVPSLPSRSRTRGALAASGVGVRQRHDRLEPLETGGRQSFEDLGRAHTPLHAGAGRGVVPPGSQRWWGLVRWCEMVVEGPVRHLCSHRNGDLVGGAEVNAGEDARVDRVVLDVGGNVVVPRNSRRDGR